MTFLLKKIISMFLMPLPLGVAFILLGLLFLYRYKLQKAKIMLTLSVLWFFMWSYSPFVNTILQKLESTYPTMHQVPKNIQYIYVLGGGHTTDNTLPITSQIYNSSVVRLNEGVRLYNQLDKKAKIILSGYSGLYDSTPHAQMQSKLAIALGVDKEHIILYPEPKDTQEEAMKAKELLGKSPFVLVTSASHMKRAMKFFTHEELSAMPAPTNHLASVKNLRYTDIFSSNSLMKSRIVFHESLGLLWQKIKGM
ncbi:MAG: envelope biogenesis factor ElyC [Campylobacterota bacterium]|nr:envelope biogenesis factor ElyC [Campylobacterota bacterium]